MKLATIILALLNSIATFSQNSVNTSDNLEAYRIVAYKNTNTNIVSVSNTVLSPKKLHINVPNAFSPDGDGINDGFIAVSDGVEEYSINIYNRWGEVVYHSEDIRESWDGEFKGRKLMQDAYVYVINAKGLQDGSQTTLKGTVSLIR